MVGGLCVKPVELNTSLTTLANLQTAEAIAIKPLEFAGKPPKRRASKPQAVAVVNAEANVGQPPNGRPNRNYPEGYNG